MRSLKEKIKKLIGESLLLYSEDSNRILEQLDSLPNEALMQIHDVLLASKEKEKEAIESQSNAKEAFFTKLTETLDVGYSHATDAITEQEHHEADDYLDSALADI